MDEKTNPFKICQMCQNLICLKESVIQFYFDTFGLILFLCETLLKMQQISKYKATHSTRAPQTKSMQASIQTSIAVKHSAWEVIRHHQKSSEYIQEIVRKH